MTAAAAATGTTRQFNDIQWRDPWSKDRGHPDSSAGKTTDTSFVASLGSAPIAWSEVDRSPSAATSSQNSYKPLIGPSSVFTKPLLAGEEPPRVRTPLQQRQHQPDSHARPRRSSFNSHNPIPRASAKKEEQRSMSHFRRPRSASFSDLRSAARDHAKSRDPKNMPPVPRLPPMQYAPKPALGCFPPITARPRLQSIDVTPPTRLYTQQHPGQLLSIPSRSSMASEISVSAQSMIRQMNSFAEEREAWRQGHRYPQGINPSTTHRDKRFKSMPVGTKRPILPPSESSATLTPQSCSLKVPQTRGRQWKRGKSNKKETQDSAQVQPNPQPSPSKHYNEDSRRTDDLFRSPTPPRRFQRTRQTSEMLPEFSFEQNGPSHLNPTESPAATRRKRTSSLSALDHASHYSLTPSGHLVGYGMALGETSREQLAQYYGTATNTGEPERFREQSTDTPLKRTSKGDYYRLPMRSAPTPPDLQHLEDPDDSGEVVFSGQNVHRESSHPTLHVDDNSAHSGTLHGQSVDNDAHLALESELPVQRLPLPNEGQSRHTGSSQSRASSSALSDDRFTNFENLVRFNGIVFI